MRLRIRNETTFTFDPPTKFAIQTLRMTPRGHEGQHVGSWRLDIDADCRLRASEDTFGNVTHTFSVDGPLPKLAIVAEGEVETFDNAGVVRGSIERFPPELYLRETDLTCATRELRAFALDCTKGNDGALDSMHRLMDTLHEKMTVDPKAQHDAMLSGADAFAKNAVAATDFSHVLLACARYLEIPARLVEGYFLASGETGGKTGAHSWVEALVEGLGWVGFDPAHGVCPQESHVRVAIGLDRLGAAPVRLAQISGSTPNTESRITVQPARQTPASPTQHQNQTQS